MSAPQTVCSSLSTFPILVQKPGSRLALRAGRLRILRLPDRSRRSTVRSDHRTKSLSTVGVAAESGSKRRHLLLSPACLQLRQEIRPCPGCHSTYRAIVGCIAVASTIPTHTKPSTHRVLHNTASGSVRVLWHLRSPWLAPFFPHPQVPPLAESCPAFARDTQSLRSHPRQCTFVHLKMLLLCQSIQKGYSFVTCNPISITVFSPFN